MKDKLIGERSAEEILKPCPFCGGEAEIKQTGAGQKDGWISVKDRLPKDDQRLLVSDGNAITFGRYFRSNQYGHIFIIDGWCKSYNVTHWMPLPNPPKP